LTPHGRMHCNDLKVRAPSSQVTDPTMGVRDWPATSGEVAMTSLAWAHHFDGIEEISQPGGGNSLVAPRRCLHQLLQWSRSPRRAHLEDGAPKKNQAGPSTQDAKSAWSTSRCPRLSKLVLHLPKQTAETDRCHCRAERHGPLFHSTRKWSDGLEVSSCSHEESGCSVRLASESRVRTLLSQGRWRTNASTRGLSGLTAFEQQFP